MPNNKTPSPQNTKKQVLADHKRIGKKLVPPMLQLGEFHEISWVRYTLPELLWLALLNNQYGLKIGSDLAVSLAKAALSTCDGSQKRWFAPISSYTLLTKDQKTSIVETLGTSDNLVLIKSSLATLVALYPDCPLAFIFDDDCSKIEENSMTLDDFKTFLISLYDKYGQTPTLAQANAIYIAFATDMLTVAPHTSLANFRAVADFPKTEESEKVAAGVRAAVNGFMGQFLNEKFGGNFSSWSRNFWNQGLELEACTLGGH